MSLTYAVPDLHGRFDLFTAAIAEIEARGGGLVIFLGDYVDRGPQSRQIVEALIAGPPEGQSWICLKGNHEDMMVETITAPLDPDWWIGNGGAQTVESYGGEVPLAHIRWLAALPLIHETEQRIFSHAGGNPGKAVAEQAEQDLCWFRVPRGLDYALAGKHTVHGHTPFRDGPVLLPNRTNLDTYAVGTGRLAVGVFDPEKPGGPIEVIEVRVPSPPLALVGA